MIGAYSQHMYAQQVSFRFVDSIFNKFAQPSVSNLANTSNYYVVSSSLPLPPTMKMVRQIDEHIYIVKVNDGNAPQLLKPGRISWANNNWKLSPQLQISQPSPSSHQHRYIVTTDNLTAFIHSLNKFKQIRIRTIDSASASVVVECSQEIMYNELLPLDEVIFVDASAMAQTETGVIGHDRSLHRINTVDHLIPGANGHNIVVGVKEQKIDEDDIDVWKRVLPSGLAAPEESNHATVIASLIGGAGNSYYDGRGIASACSFFPSSFANLFADPESDIKSNRVTVQNHSYGTIIQQFYGAEAISYDMLTWRNKEFVAVFSAGNKGAEATADGPYANLPGYSNLTGNFKMAKNIITVGAVEKDETISPQNSSGPTYDGRLAPHIMALGANGTSDAAAIVSGTIAVLQQVYRDTNDQSIPPSSLTKAVLYASARDMHTEGIDYKTGFGLLNSYDAVRTMQTKSYDGGEITQGQVWTKTITIPANAAQLRVVLSWTDSAASVNNFRALLNDLDLEVIHTSSGDLYHPWILNTSPDIALLSLPARRGRDSLNTSEMVTVRLPVAGPYAIKVRANNLINTLLPFHVAYKIDTLNSFAFTNPVHSSDVNANETDILPLRWMASVADSSQTGTISLSYDGGSTWQSISNTIRIANEKYDLQIKDTAAVGMLKMETNGNAYMSSPFILAPSIRPIVDFNCADSFRLSWNKYIYADSYRVYALTDSPFLQPVLTVADTFVVLRRSTSNSDVYAVEPLMRNGLTAPRSIAINIASAGTACFYKTLNYTLINSQTLNLQLELSAAGYVDSVYFETVSSSGVLLQSSAGIKVTDDNFVYTYLLEQLSSGLTYVRARMKLKGGQSVYTEIVSVLTSGSRNIWVFPNPVRRGAPVRFILRNGLFSGDRLQILDMYGRVLRTYTSLPESIDTSTFPAGVIVVKLLNNQNEPIETVKVVVY
jgi:hypothetical protein